MEVVGAVVDKELVIDSVERKSALCDTVAEPTDNRTLIAVALNVVGKIIVTADNVGKLSLSVGNEELIYRTAKRDYAHAHSAVNSKGIFIDRFSERFAKITFFYIHIDLHSNIGAK